jgi:hypothetical protein
VFRELECALHADFGRVWLCLCAAQGVRKHMEEVGSAAAIARPQTQRMASPMHGLDVEQASRDTVTTVRLPAFAYAWLAHVVIAVVVDKLNVVLDCKPLRADVEVELRTGAPIAASVSAASFAVTLAGDHAPAVSVIVRNVRGGKSCSRL